MSYVSALRPTVVRQRAAAPARDRHRMTDHHVPHDLRMGDRHRPALSTR